MKIAIERQLFGGSDRTADAAVFWSHDLICMMPVIMGNNETTTGAISLHSGYEATGRAMLLECELLTWMRRVSRGGKYGDVHVHIFDNVALIQTRTANLGIDWWTGGLRPDRYWRSARIGPPFGLSAVQYRNMEALMCHACLELKRVEYCGVVD